jgi:hypothetical protein
LILLDWWSDGSTPVIMIPGCEESQVLLVAVRAAVVGFGVMKGRTV